MEFMWEFQLKGWCKMMTLLKICFFISGFLIFWAMIGYPISIQILGKIYKNRKNLKNYSLQPSVTIMIVAHNEEKVIKEKLDNVCCLNYPKDKLCILVASDNSSDHTNVIVNQYIKEHSEMNIRLYVTKEHKGKTNAQNEAQKTITTDFIVMTDANAMLDKNSVKELMASFTDHKIAYVTGCLKYTNIDNNTASSEGNYWDSDVMIRDIESRIQTITAGNGALYACRNQDYYDIPLIECHDSTMPYDFALKGRRAINDLKAIAYEKAGENDQDEFKRKVRMNRIILIALQRGIKSLNFFKYKWFTFFYFGHRTCRYLLWINHIILFLTNIFICGENIIYYIFLLLQIGFYVLGLVYQNFNLNNKLLKMIHYYMITILAQWLGVINTFTGKTKSTWEKASSTR